MAAGDLTTLANVEAWLGVPSDGGPNDAILSRLITRVSALVPSVLSRNLVSQSYSERYDGRGCNSITLRNYPVSSIQAVNFDGQSVSVAASGNPPSGGYLLDNAASGATLTLTEFSICRGRLNVQVNYTAGYLISGEAAMVPSGSTHTVQTLSTWIGDAGVTYANGTPLTMVAGAPALGQYAVTAGVYTFSPADAGAAVLLSYSFCPPDIEQAVIEIVGEAYRRRDRIGQVSKTLGGQETVSFSQKAMHDIVSAILMPQKRVAPI